MQLINSHVDRMLHSLGCYMRVPVGRLQMWRIQVGHIAAQRIGTQTHGIGVVHVVDHAANTGDKHLNGIAVIGSGRRAVGLAAPYAAKIISLQRQLGACFGLCIRKQAHADVVRCGCPHSKVSVACNLACGFGFELRSDVGAKLCIQAGWRKQRIQGFCSLNARCLLHPSVAVLLHQYQL